MICFDTNSIHDVLLLPVLLSLVALIAVVAVVTAVNAPPIIKQQVAPGTNLV
jgi:hypothetical protein